MQRTMIGLVPLLLAGMAQAQTPADCGSLPAQKPAVQPTLVAPLSPELTAPRHQLGAPTGVLAQSLDESLAVDNVLLRLRIENCLAVAKAAPASAPSLPSATDAAAYKPKTQFDNTPWRFDMSQNGKRMTAEEFDAWMKARGVRVAKGAPGAAAPPPPPAPVAPPKTDDKKP